MSISCAKFDTSRPRFDTALLKTEFLEDAFAQLAFHIKKRAIYHTHRPSAQSDILPIGYFNGRTNDRLLSRLREIKKRWRPAPLLFSGKSQCTFRETRLEFHKYNHVTFGINCPPGLAVGTPSPKWDTSWSRRGRPPRTKGAFFVRQ